MPYSLSFSGVPYLNFISHLHCRHHPIVFSWGLTSVAFLFHVCYITNFCLWEMPVSAVNLVNTSTRCHVYLFLQTMIEAHVDVKTTDGYLLRIFCIGFTKKRLNQIKKTCYAKSSQVRAIRKKMVDIISKEVTSNDLKEVVKKL